ncbi:amidase [Pseudomonas brassicacearum]|uniref:Amidase n=1 Tax=Pseudomonas brassicacearum TaxID=930166 RepID=A0A423GVQ6_9PSED|nr:amidase [Pseudomonas brassicacearum]RON01676.1 amidase [Pseudomonas brassicacearum]
MNLGFIRRRPRLSVLLLLIAVLLGWIWQERVALWAFPDIISAYTAKEYCSCRYVENNPADYCQGYVKQYVPISGFLDDAPNKRVTASGMGRSHTAAWIGARQGCRLTP